MWFSHPAQAVDTHIFRFGNRSGVAVGKDVAAVERAIEDHVPAEFQQHAHHWMILHGRYVCKARKPECPDCVIHDLCRSGTRPRDRQIQVVGIGNAMVDILAHCEESFLVEHGVRKGVMQLIDGQRAADIRRVMESPSEVSGGSAANTIAGLADMGCRTAYVGKVVDDRLGHVFADDIRSLGVKYETPMTPSGQGTDTGCCMVLVTPDGERSMNTYLGASETLGSRDIDRRLMERRVGFILRDTGSMALTDTPRLQEPSSTARLEGDAFR